MFQSELPLASNLVVPAAPVTYTLPVPSNFSSVGVPLVNGIAQACCTWAEAGLSHATPIAARMAESKILVLTAGSSCCSLSGRVLKFGPFLESSGCNPSLAAVSFKQNGTLVHVAGL